MSPKILTLWGKGWRFFVTGVTSNVLFYCLYLLLLWLSVPYQIALTICYILGMLWGFLVNKYWSWKDESPVLRSAILYILSYGFIYFCHLGFVSYLVEYQDVSPEWAALISLAVLIIPLFVLLDRLVYRLPKTRS